MRFLALLAALGILVAGCGGDGGGDVPKDELIASYEETVPPAFDAYVAALKEGDSSRVCDDFLTAAGVDAIEAESGEPCQLAVTHGTPTDISSRQFTLEDLRLAANDDVQAFYSGSGGSGDSLTFVAVDGEWRVAYEADPAIVKERDRFESQAQELEGKLYGRE